METQVREARPEDYDGIAQVYAEADLFHSQALPLVFRAAGPAARPRAYVEALLADADHGVFIAECHGSVVGVIHVSARETPPLPILVPRRYAHVSDIAVRGQWRRRGIGRALMARAEEWARARGLESIELNVWAFNSGAVAFYGALGYGDLRHTLSRRVEPAPTRDE